ncbi:MAG: radical SAM protein [Candidatus Omnitrophota bacterium]|nr:radical SAM protein [Candidatus Omnitrophota bacterium]
MRYSKVLLINPRIAGSYLGPVRPPVSLGYLGQSLEISGVQAEMIDLALGYKLRHLWDKIERFKPELIGVTVWTYKYKDTYNLIRIIKRKYPGIHIVVGGPHISTLRVEALGECSEIDFGVVLEGESTLIELCQGKDFSEIKGLMYYQDKKLLYNGDREFITELDSIPFPKYQKLELSKYFLKEITLISSRGCPYSCIYCPVKLAIGRNWRARNAKSVVDEIEYWYNKSYRRFNFTDDNFTFFKERVYEICDEVQSRGLKNLDLHCGNGIRADKVDKPLLKRMKEVGFNYIGLGVEAGNNRILKNLRKGESIEQIEQTIKDACDLNYDVTLFFLAGSPGETSADIEDSVRLAEKYPVFEARFYNIIPYPGTELFAWLNEKKLFLRDPQDYLNDASAFSDKPLFETEELSRKERVKMFRRLRKVENLILKKTIKRKLGKFGWAGRFAAIFLSPKIIYYFIRHQKFMRRLFEKVRSDAFVIG